VYMYTYTRTQIHAHTYDIYMHTHHKQTILSHTVAASQGVHHVHDIDTLKSRVAFLNIPICQYRLLLLNLVCFVHLYRYFSSVVIAIATLSFSSPFQQPTFTILYCTVLQVGVFEIMSMGWLRFVGSWAP